MPDLPDHSGAPLAAAIHPTLMSQDRTALRLFIEIMGDRPARDDGHREIDTFLQTLRQLPSVSARSPRERRIRVADFISAQARLGTYQSGLSPALDG
ncbi:hypothetical protein D9599_21385 [Roseomonas sp. KE2513]|nr:hypothetical protein [Roseomonas sp. KE2513]